MDKFFVKNNNILIPTASVILQNVTFDQRNSLPLKQDDGSHISVSAGLVIPPWLTTIIASESIRKASDILLLSIEYSKNYISKSALDQVLIKYTPIHQDDFNGYLDKDIIPEGDLIHQLFGWTRFNTTRPLCTDLGAGEDIDIRHQAL